ncbi:MAG: cytidylate kinase-like family protein [Lachnospiraceae bacterium]|nr:cytidylate kinase-like family protein [Lachnospiraceae bacterium]
MENYVITVARETGSGGHNITRKLSAKLGIPYYDRDLLRMASDISGIHEGLFGLADERIGVRELFSSAEKVYTGEVLPPDSDDYTSTKNLFNFQAKLIKDLADKESCIILGRCANYLLMNRTNVLKVFIHAPVEARVARVSEINMAWKPREVVKHIREEDKRRAAYYRYYTGEEWRDAGAYDISLDSSALGEEGCVDAICRFLPVFLPGLEK